MDKNSIKNKLSSIKNKLSSTKNKLIDNRTKILITAAVVSTTVAVIQHYGIKSVNSFLKEKNLFDEYYHMNEDEN